MHLGELIGEMVGNYRASSATLSTEKLLYFQNCHVIVLKVGTLSGGIITIFTHKPHAITRHFPPHKLLILSFLTMQTFTVDLWIRIRPMQCNVAHNIHKIEILTWLLLQVNG